MSDDASTEITLRCYLTVRVVGEQMDDEELAGAIGPFGAARKLEREVERALRLDVGHADALGWAGNRQAFIDELLSVDLVEEMVR